MGNYKTEFLQSIISYYQPMSAETLTLEDGREIADNLADLGRWIIKAKKLIREKAGRLLQGVRIVWDYVNPFSKSKAAKFWRNCFNMNQIYFQLKIFGNISDTFETQPEKIDLKHCERFEDLKHSEVIS